MDIAAVIYLFSILQLTIQVTDINDNAPSFSSPEYSFLTVESYDLNTNIGEVRAVDRDSGVNGEIVYTIDSVEPVPRTPGLIRITFIK